MEREKSGEKAIITTHQDNILIQKAIILHPIFNETTNMNNYSNNAHQTDNNPFVFTSLLSNKTIITIILTACSCLFSVYKD